MTNQLTTPSPIKKIILRNIQSLPKAEIEPAPPGQLTVIIGESDSGKTALASRAMQKLFFNSIPTKELIRRGTKQASITAIYDTPDNLSISWVWKGRKPNAGKAWYEIRRDNMKPIILEGSNRPGNVPDTVQELTGVRPVKIGNTTLNFNFNRQLDGPFLGGVSPTERYRVLGALAGTLEVDEAVKEVGLEIHRARRREKELVGEIDTLEAKIKEYDYLKELGQTIEQVEASVAEIQEKQKKRDTLVRLQHDIKNEQFACEAVGSYLQILNDTIQRTEQGLVKVEKAVTRYQKLLAAWKGIDLENFALTNAKSIIDLTQTIPEIISKLRRVSEQHSKLTEVKKLVRNIENEKNKLITTNNVLKQTENHKQAAELLERVVAANHTHNILMPLMVEIPKMKKQIMRSAVILEQTAAVDEGMGKLGKVTDSVNKVSKLRELAVYIQVNKNSMAQAGTVLMATEGIDPGMELITRIETAKSKLHKLQLLDISIQGTRKTAKEKADLVDQFTAKIELGIKEYRELLHNAGICENCPVVNEVMAAVG